MQDNVIRFQKKPDLKPQHPPLINLPFATKILLALIVSAFVILWGLGYLVPNLNTDMIYIDFGFVSAKWSGDIEFRPIDILSLITVNFLHAGWFHLGINAVTLAAFAAGMEKRMGAKNMLIVFFLSSALACLTHLAVSPHSQEPLIGASGGISGLFGAVLVMLKHDNQLQGQRILPMVILWIVISVGFGMMGGPNDEQIAWVAHIGGFIAGLGISWLMLNKFKPAA